LPGITESPGSTPFQAAPWMTVQKACSVMKFALAAYGWPFYSYSHLPFGCCVLCCTSPRLDFTLLFSLFVRAVYQDCTVEAGNMYVDDSVFWISCMTHCSC